MSQLVIVPLQDVHLNACLPLWQQAGMAHEPDLLDRLTRLLARFPNLSKVAIADGQVIGCVLCSYNEFSLYVFRLVVDLAYRGHGIGKRLMEECERSAHAIGAAKVMLNAEGEVATWYERLGYRKTAAQFLFKEIV